MKETEKISNYEITKRNMQKEFLKYDQDKMIQKFQLLHDPEFIYINFIGRDYRISRSDGTVEWSEDAFSHVIEAGFNEVMSLYDVLCNAKENCHLSGEMVNMGSLSSIRGSSSSVGNGFYRETEKWFDHREAELIRACERLNGSKCGKGDVAYRIPVFDFLAIQIQFWNSDEEFRPSLQIYLDRNILQFMHYETVWYAVSHLLYRIKKEML